MTTPDITMTDDQMQSMPWTRHLMKPIDLARWVAGRREAGQAIDINSCELGRWPADIADPYGVGDGTSEKKEIATERFVRSPTSNGWIHKNDLPIEKMIDMYEKEYRTTAHVYPDDPHALYLATPESEWRHACINGDPRCR
jgi:hypothetical protein